MPPRSSRQPALAKVHLARKALALTDDSYRDLLHRITGRRSAADLTDAQLDQVLAEFKRLGWSAQSKTGKPPLSSKPEVRKIFGVWKGLHERGVVSNGARPAVVAFVKRMTGVDDPNFLNPAQANTVIEALKAMGKRAGAKHG